VINEIMMSNILVEDLVWIGAGNLKLIAIWLE